MNPQTIEQANTVNEEENSETFLSGKEIIDLSVLRKVVNHRVDERGFERRYSYTNMELLNVKKKINIGRYIF